MGALFAFTCMLLAMNPEQARTGASDISDSPEPARIVFLRTRESQLYVARKAPIRIDGQKAGSLGYGQWLFADVAPGERRLRIRNWDSAGSCEVVLDVQPGTTYHFQVDPRQESFNAFTGGDLAGLVLGQDIWISAAAGATAQRAESYARECAGLFRLYPVAAGQAERVLSGLEHVE